MKKNLIMCLSIFMLFCINRKIEAQVTVTAQTIIDDMTLVPDAALHGVPSNYSWADGKAAPQPMPVPAKNNKGQWWRAMTTWGQAYIPVTGSSATNTRMQIRNLVTKLLYKSGKWYEVQHGDPQGAAFVEDFVNNASMSAGERNEAANGGGKSVIVGVGQWAGHNYHFWPTGSRANVDIDSVVGVFNFCEARLIVDNPNLPDDRDICKNTLQMGADWWLDQTGGWLPDWSANSGIGGCRSKWVTKDWQSFNFSTLLPEDIIKNPPSDETGSLATFHGVRGCPIIKNGTILTDQGTLLRGGAIICPTSDLTEHQAAWGLNINNWIEAKNRKLNFMRSGNKRPISDPNQLEYLDRIVANAEATGMYVSMMVDIAEPGSFDYQSTYDFWKVVAPRYANNTNVIYEITNEPAGFPANGSYPMNSELLTIYNIMREAAPQKIIICGKSSQLTYNNNSHNVMVVHNYSDPIAPQTVSELIPNFPIFMDETNQWQYPGDVSVEREARRIKAMEDYGISWAIMGTDLSNQDRVLEEFDQLKPYLNKFGISWIHDQPITKGITMDVPAQDSRLSNTKPIKIEATPDPNDNTVVKVEFFMDNLKIGEVHEKPTILSWESTALGSHNLWAKMISIDGDTTYSSPVHISLIASEPPTVAISQPFNNSVFPENTNVIIDVAANDPDGSITKVSFFNGETKLGECLNSPYHFEWTNLSPGSYSITAVATDNTETSTTSLPVNFTMGDCNSGTNQLLNPEFDDLTSTWKTWNDGGSAFTKSVVNDVSLSGTNALKVDISNASGLMGIRLWTNLDFKNGHNYRICFLAKSTVNKQVKIAFKERGLNGTEYWSQNISIDALSTNYGPYFFPCDRDYPNGELVFYLGASAGTIWLDKVKVADQNLTGIFSQKLNKVQIYPNPVTEEFLRITADDLMGETISLTIYNQTGQRVFNESICYSGPIQIPVSQLLGNGIYLVNIQTETETYTQKIIVSNLK